MAYKKKITFKKGTPYTGLSAVCSGTPDTDIKYNGYSFGYISFNDHWNAQRKGIRVHLQKKVENEFIDNNPDRPRKWKWIILKDEFPSEEAAREKVLSLQEQLIDGGYVYLESEDK